MKSFRVLSRIACVFCASATLASAQDLSIVSGDKQTLTVGQNSSTPIVVTLCQPGEIVCSGLQSTTISFQVQTDEPWANICDSTFTTCGATGSVTIPPRGSEATVYVQAGGVPGSYTITATIAGTTTSVTFHFTNLVGPPASLEACCGQNFQAVEGQQFPSVSFEVRDSFGNVTTTPISVTLTAPSTEPSGNFSGSRTATIQTANGFGAVLNFTADNATGTYKLHASASCCTPLDFTLTNTAPTTPVNVTVTSVPAGLTLEVDGMDYQMPHTFSWNPNSAHTLLAPSPQTIAAGTYAFSSWSSNAPNGLVTVGSSAETVTATFTQTAVTQYLLSVTASPTSQGSVAVNPKASDGSTSNGTYSGHYNAGTVVQITATPAPGYVFLNWGPANTDNPLNVTMNSATTLTGHFATAIPTTIATSPAGLSISVDGQTYTAPQTFQWTQMSPHTIGTTSPQTSGASRYTFANWSDGGAIAHTISVGAAAATFTATFNQSSSALSLTCGSAGSAQVGVNVSFSCTATGGSPPYTFSVSAGALPPGVNLTPQGATATIAGSPTTAGPYSFTVQALDSGTPAQAATQVENITVAQATVLSITPPGLTFTAYQGRGNPPSQILQVTSASGASGFSIANIPAWMQVTPTTGITPASITIAVTASSLAAGKTTGTISIAPGAGPATSVNIQANLDPFSIGVASPVSFSAASGTTNSQTLMVTTADNGPASVEVTATTATGGSWLTLPSATLSAPGTLNYTIDTMSLAAGNYTGTITLSCVAANLCAPVPVTINLTVTQGAPIVAISQVLNATGEAPLISQNTWIEIKGTNLSQTMRTWQSSDFNPATGLMPTELDGVSATVNGNPAYVWYISLTQVNVLTPLDPSLGPVAVVLKNSLGTSAPATVTMIPNALGFFAFESAKYAAAIHLDGSLLGPASLYPGQTTPAAPGETIVLYGNGFGEVTPAINQGAAAQAGVLPYNPTVTIGGLPASVIFAGVVTPGLYQFNVAVPANAPNGDLALSATYNGVGTQQGVVVTVMGH